MGESTHIEWTRHTWNPWYGCAKVSPGCEHCYMFREMRMYGRDPEEVTRSKTKFREPLKWSEPAFVFTCSWSDFFIEEADAWRADAWDIIRRTPHLTYQVLTKRPGRIAQSLPPDWGAGWPNVLLGVSVEGSLQAQRISTLAKIPGRRFISFEPLLEDIERLPWLGMGAIEWAIVGGESGPQARSMDLNWAARIVSVCKTYDVRCFVKQLGSRPRWNDSKVHVTDRGQEMEEWPLHLRVREMPPLRLAGAEIPANVCTEAKA